MLPLLVAGDPPEPGGEFEFCFGHALDHEWAWLPAFSNFKLMVLLAAALLVLIAVRLNKTSLVPQGLFRNAFESLLIFMRDEMVRPTMGHHGDRFLPFFCTIFVFILAMNLLGMVPIPVVGGTATSNLMVTGALAAIVLIVSVASGVAFHGDGFLGLFVPGGLPVALVPALFVLEIAGFFVKHSVLMVRLFANMIAGHLVIGAFFGLIFVFNSYLVAGALSVPMALFISGLELLVAVLQAYVFTLLSVLFIGSMVHPDH